MAGFRSLDDIIKYQLERRQINRELPMGSPGAVTSGVNQPFINSASQVKGVLQWGFSTWGVEPVIGSDTPQNRN
jgi:hypothetical protein